MFFNSDNVLGPVKIRVISLVERKLKSKTLQAMYYAMYVVLKMK
jgi:hypothetical protein